MDGNGAGGENEWVEADRRAWIERLVEACDRVRANVPDSDDPYFRTLLADVDALRVRLEAELAGEDRPGS